jgi:uncharacterized protein
MINEIFSLQNPWRERTDYAFNLKPRQIFNTIVENLDNELILGLTGSRQVGKSSLIYLLIQHLLKSETPLNQIFYFNLDDYKLHELFTSIPEFIQFIGKDESRKYIFIDEIQRLASPGLFLKKVFDLRKNIKIVYSGSSQLEIKAKTKEHLVGRARTFQINRLSFSEYIEFANPITKKDALNQMLLFGSYPKIALARTPMEKKLRIKDIYQSYIQKDLVDFLNLDKLDVYNRLLVCLANQVGDLVNIHSLSNSLRISQTDTEKYLNILENTFVCKRIYPFHKNYSKEITKTPKLYFLDLGLRNFTLNNFIDLNLRDDAGKLFENFYFIELLANDFYGMNKINFWRTTNQTEIDFIVQGDNLFEAIEVKWKDKKIPKSFATLNTHYPEIKTKMVSAQDFL